MIRTPVKIKYNEGHFKIQGSAVFKFAPKKDYGCLLELCGIKSYSAEDCERFEVTVGEAEAAVCEFSGDEAYSLRITPSGTALCANSENGISQGLKLLALLNTENPEGIPCMEVSDEPQIAFRAAHLCIFNPLDGTEKERTDPEDIKRRIKILALTGYNHVFLEFWGMFPYKKHPYACWPHSEFTRETVEDIIGFAIDKMHITPLPCQNLTSHAGWSRIASRKHVVLDQRPDLADMWIPGGWCFATENPKTKAFLRDIIDDLIETFRNPPLLHASCDKCFGFGSTEEDRTKPADALFAAHICNLNSYLQARGVRMVMWGDMLYSSMDALYWKPAPAIADALPKNILINIWTHNDIGTHWADVDFFESRGYETVYSPFINRDGAESMVKLCKRKGSLGMVQTTWHRPESTMPTAVFTAGLSWSGRPATDAETEKFLNNI